MQQESNMTEPLVGLRCLSVAEDPAGISRCTLTGRGETSVLLKARIDPDEFLGSLCTRNCHTPSRPGRTLQPRHTARPGLNATPATYNLAFCLLIQFTSAGASGAVRGKKLTPCIKLLGWVSFPNSSAQTQWAGSLSAAMRQTMKSKLVEITSHVKMSKTPHWYVYAAALLIPLWLSLLVLFYYYWCVFFIYLLSSLFAWWCVLFVHLALNPIKWLLPFMAFLCNGTRLMRFEKESFSGSMPPQPSGPLRSQLCDHGSSNRISFSGTFKTTT